MSDATDRAQALVEVNRLGQPNVEPTIQPWEVEEILDRHQRAARWVTAVEVAYNDFVVPTVRNGHRYRVIIAGTTGVTEPSWSTTTGATIDAEPQFQEAGLDFANVYDIQGAVHKIWALKTARSSEFANNPESGAEASIYEHCKEMMRIYGRPLIA